MKVTEARKITDSLTRTSKMPGLSYSLPAWACQTGSKLRKVKTSPCYGCYALKNNYTRYPAIKEAQYRRLDAINHPQWVEAMAAQIKRQKWFRWHDAGDLQSRRLSIEGLMQSITRYGSRLWPRRSSGKNGLDGMTLAMSSLMSIWQKLLKYASSHLTQNTGYQRRSVSTYRSRKRSLKI